MPNRNSSVDELALEFFREFSRYEYCLKAVGLRKSKKVAEADWLAYAREEAVVRLFESPDKALAEAVKYFVDRPPKKQVVVDGKLEWDDSAPNHKTQPELILQLVCRVRNNLFHGGKFNGHWFEPQRSVELLSHGLLILEACARAHPKIGEAYAGRAI